MKSLALVASLLLASTTAWAGVEDQLRVRYAQWDAAYRAHDVKTLAGMLHPRFRLVTHTGRLLSRTEYVASLWKSQPPKLYATTLERASAKGHRALAWTTERSGSAAKAHAHTYRDTWLLTNGRWLLVESRTLSED